MNFKHGFEIKSMWFRNFVISIKIYNF